MKRVLSLVLALVMVLGMIPTFAADMTGGEHLLEHGFITGKPGDDVATKLDAGAALTRQELAALIAELMGQKDEAAVFAQPADYADADKIGAWAVPYVAYAQVNGWMSGKPGNMFDPTGPVPGQQLAAVLMNALGYTVDTQAKYATVIADAAALGVVVPSSNLTRGAAFEAMWTAVSEVNVNGEEVTLGVKLGKLEPKQPELLPLVAQSVKADNIKWIHVQFNNELDPTTVVKANFKLNGSALAANDSLILSEDAKMVTINLDTPFTTNQTSFEVTVKGIKDVAGQTLAETKLTGTAFDVTIPTVVKAEQVGPSKIKVTFSEPVQLPTTANLKVDDGQYFIDGSTIVLNAKGDEVTFELYTTIPLGTRSVTVTGVKDLVNYTAVTTTVTFEAFKDEVAPTVVKVVKATPEQLVIEMSEDITIAGTAVAANFYHTNTNNTVDVAGFSVVNGNQLKLEFTTNKLPQGTAYVYIAKDVLLDGWNNKNAAITLTVQVTVDTTKPEVKSVVAKDDETIVITFNEDVNTSKAVFKVLDSTGKEVTSPTFVAADTAADKVELQFNDALPGSTYTVVIEKVEDVAGNIIEKVSIAVAVTDTTAPTINAAGYLYGSKQIVKIMFNEAMNQEDLLNLGNYIYAGKYLTAYEATASITDNGKAVLLDFSKDTTITIVNNNQITVGKVRDVAGNAVAALSTLVTLADQDAVGIAVSKVEATGTKTIKVTLSDSLSKFDAADFKVQSLDTTPDPDVYANLAVASVTFANVDGKGVITFTLVNALTTEALSTTLPVVVVTRDSADIVSANVFGVKVKGSEEVTADDKIGPAIASAVFASDNTITITFTEDVKADTLSRFTFTVSGNTVTAAALVGDNGVTLTLKDAVTVVGTKVTITQALNIEDVLGNVTTGLTKEVTR